MRPEEFKDGRLLKSKSIALNDLENGEYRLIVNLRQSGATEVLSSANIPLRIQSEKSELPLYFLADSQALARPGVAAYLRGLEAASQKDGAAATAYFQQALNQNSSNTFAGEYLVQLYFEQKQFAPIAELYKKLGISAFKTSPVTLAQIALSFRQSGDATQARDVIAAALGYFPGNPLLTSAASSLKIPPPR